MVGAVAQLGEHLLCKQGVSGSIPLSSTNLVPDAAAPSALRSGRAAERSATTFGLYWRSMADAGDISFEEIKVCTTRIALVPVLQKSWREDWSGSFQVWGNSRPKLVPMISLMA
jgi:hypothetical protein